MHKAVILLVFLLQIGMSSAAVITVGDSLGWTNFDLATQRVPDYAAWAASQPVAPGDSLVFKYTPGLHNVALFSTKEDFDNCNFAKSKVLDNGSGNFTWVAPEKTGVYYFACGFAVEGQGTHCDGGQKVSITLAATTPSLPPSIVPSPSPIKPPSLSPKSGLAPITPAFAPLSSVSSPAPSPPLGAATSPSPMPGIVVPGTGDIPSSPTSPSGSLNTSSVAPESSTDKSSSDGGYCGSSFFMVMSTSMLALVF